MAKVRRSFCSSSLAARRRPLACALALLLCAVVLPRAHAQRLVFAHYMLTNQDYQGDDDPTQEKKIAAYEREIRQAQAAGIDGFALNAGGWLRQPYYLRYAAQMFEAASRLHSNFKLFFSADFCCGNTAADVEDMMRRFAANPRYARVYFRHHGRPVLTTFAGDTLGVPEWMRIRADLALGTSPSTSVEANVLAPVAAAPGAPKMKIFLVTAFFWGGEVPQRQDIEAGLAQWKDIIDGAFYWGIAGIPGSQGPLDTLAGSTAYAQTLHAAHKLYMAPVCLQFWGANANRYYEYSGAQGMRALWSAAARSQADWVEIITWNDFIEGTYVSPIDDANKYPGANFLDASGIPLGTRHYFHSHAGAAALLPYFIQGYKQGAPPAITSDTVAYFYRTQPFSSSAARPPVTHKFGPVQDVIYITANLVAPADLEVTSNGTATLLHLPAGSSDTRTPFHVGDPPGFSLLRNRQVTMQGQASDPIQTEPAYNNFYYATGALLPLAPPAETARPTPQSQP